MAAAEPEEQWERMKTILQETTAEVVGLSTRKHQGWFDETDMETPELFEMKAPATIVCLQYVMIKPLRLHTRVPAVHSGLSKLRTLQNESRTGLADRTQRYTDMRAFYEALKAVYEPSHQI